MTDRLEEASRFVRALGAVAPCAAATLDAPAGGAGAEDLLICDAALGDDAALARARAALDAHRVAEDVPLLCLLREPGRGAVERAQALGATAVLPGHTHPVELAGRVRQLLAGRIERSRAARVDGEAREAGAALSDLFVAAAERAPISPAALARGGDAVLAAVGRAPIRAWLDVVWRYDDATYQHCLLVAGLTAAFAHRLGLVAQSQRLLSQAALVHDLGKAHIPRAILGKPGRLSPAELAVMRTHPALGHELLAGQAAFEPVLLDVVRHHHEYLDGSGYPDGLRAEAVSPFVRMVTICDIYAALVERRAYKPPMEPAAALAVLADMGGKLDAGLLAVFGSVVSAG